MSIYKPMSYVEKKIGEFNLPLFKTRSGNIIFSHNMYRDFFKELRKVDGDPSREEKEHITKMLLNKYKEEILKNVVDKLQQK